MRSLDRSEGSVLVRNGISGRRPSSFCGEALEASDEGDRVRAAVKKDRDDDKEWGEKDVDVDIGRAKTDRGIAEGTYASTVTQTASADRSNRRFFADTIVMASFTLRLPSDDGYVVALASSCID
jgi:hypothetical protein